MKQKNYDNQYGGYNHSGHVKQQADTTHLAGFFHVKAICGRSG